MRFDILNHLGVDHEWTDGQTEPTLAIAQYNAKDWWTREECDRTRRHWP